MMVSVDMPPPPIYLGKSIKTVSQRVVVSMIADDI